MGDEDDDSLGGNAASVVSVPIPTFVILPKKAPPGRPRTVPSGDTDAVQLKPPSLPKLMAKPAGKKKDDHKRCREHVEALTDYYERFFKEKVNTYRQQAISWATYAQACEEKVEDIRTKYNTLTTESKRACCALNSMVTKQASAAKVAARKLETEK